MFREEDYDRYREHVEEDIYKKIVAECVGAFSYIVGAVLTSLLKTTGRMPEGLYPFILAASTAPPQLVRKQWPGVEKDIEHGVDVGSAILDEIKGIIVGIVNGEGPEKN